MSEACKSTQQPPNRDSYPTFCGKNQSDEALRLLNDHWRPLEANIVGNPVVLSRGEHLDVFFHQEISPNNIAIYHRYRIGAANAFSTAEQRATDIYPGFAVVSRKEGSYDMVGKGSDSTTLWHVRCIDGVWGTQEAIAKPAGPAVEILENPVLVSPDPDRVDLFVSMDDKVLYTVSKAGDGGDFIRWQSLGGAILGFPGVTSWGPNRVDLSVRGTDRRVYHKTNDNGTWIPSITGYGQIGAPLVLLGGTVGIEPLGSPAEISDRPGRLILYSIGATTNSRVIFTKAWEGQWFPNQEGSWESLGGESEDPIISAVSGQRDRRDIVIRSPGGTVMHKYFDGQRYLPSQQDWYLYGGKLAGPPVLSPAGSSRLEIFGRGVDGSLMHWREIIE